MSSVDQGKEIKSEDLEGQEKNQRPRGPTQGADEMLKPLDTGTIGKDKPTHRGKFNRDAWVEQVLSAPLNSSQKMVLFAIGFSMSESGIAEMTYDEIAPIAGLSKTTVPAVVKKIDDGSWFQRKLLKRGYRYTAANCMDTEV